MQYKNAQPYSYEPSAVFIYNMIEQYGGAEKFYGDFYINLPFPLAIIRKSSTDD